MSNTRRGVPGQRAVTLGISQIACAGSRGVPMSSASAAMSIGVTSCKPAGRGVSH